MKKKSITVESKSEKILLLFLATLKDVAKDMGLKVKIGE